MGLFSSIIHVRDVQQDAAMQALDECLAAFGFEKKDRNGKPLDGYNSLPPYFEQKPLSRKRIEEQRHDPKPFRPLLPKSVKLAQLEELLAKGWWDAYDRQKLDENQVLVEDDAFVFEEERMTAFAELLELNGPDGGYPYTAWFDSKTIKWQEFFCLWYSKLKPDRPRRNTASR